MPHSSSEARQFTLGTLFISLGLIAALLASWSFFGSSGIGPALALDCFIWFTLSRTQTASLRPMNQKPMTTVELVVLLVICFILHGLLLPADQSRPHLRRNVPANPAIPSSSEIDDDANDDGAISKFSAVDQ